MNNNNMKKRTYERIFIHTTSADYNKVNPQFLAVNRWHKNRFGYYYNEQTKEVVAPSSLGYYGGYHILIEKNGKEFRYREDREETIAVRGHNRSSLSVAMAFDGDRQLPTTEQVETLKKRLQKWSEKYNICLTRIETVGPHRLVNNRKSCYGKLLSDDLAIKLFQPIKKDKEEKLKEENTKIQLTDRLQILILQLKILLGQYIEELNKRSK